MHLIVSLLIDDRTVVGAIARRPKLNRHVQYFLNNGYRHLVGATSSNCLYVINSALLPALLAYENILHNYGDLFDNQISPHAKKKSFLTRKNEFNDLKYAFEFATGLIEKNIPDLQVGGPSEDILEENKVDKALGRVVKELAKTALRKNKNHMNSFWVLASFYYRHPPDFEQPLMPSADNPLQLIPYYPEEVKRLDNLVYDMLDNFCKKHRVVNAMTQDAEGIETRQDSLERSFYYTAPTNNYNALQFAEKCNFPENAKDEIVRDPFAYSLNIESWENLLYFDTKTHVLEYLPRKIACYLLVIKAYYRLFDMLRQGEDDMDLLNAVFAGGFQFYMSTVHLFMPSIYERNGQITENAEYLLAGFRIFKRNSPTRLVSGRGGNIWQDAISFGMRRRGHKFW